MSKAPRTETPEIFISQIDTGMIKVGVVGMSPLILHKMSSKAKNELLIPARKKNRAALEQTLKHDPITEYQDCVLRMLDPRAPTAIGFPAGGMKKSLASAALDVPGAKKAEIGRLTWIMERDVPIFGIPKLSLMVVRNSGMNKAPDIRSRPILEEWCAVFSLRYVKPNLTAENIARLFGWAGTIIGIGDGRQEKGWGSFGQFRLASADDKDLLRIMKAGGRVAQEKALNSPEYYDLETTEMMTWYGAETRKRTDNVTPIKRRAKAA